MLSLLLDSLGETLAMVAVSAIVSGVLGLPLGVFLLVTRKGHVASRPAVHAALGGIINAARSTPFVILLVAIVPLTRALVGSSIGTAAAIVPLSVAATPFVARLVEGALRDVDPALIEAAQAMGASPTQIVQKVVIPEALPGLVGAFTVTLVNLVGFSAMAGAVGGGGLGDLGIRYGYQRFQPDVMLAVVVVLIALVQVIQSTGDRLARKLDRRRVLQAA